MPAVTRVGLDSHVGHASPTPNPFHQTAYATGSSNVFTNSAKTVRVGDTTSCGDPATAGSPDVFVNGIAIHRSDCLNVRIDLEKGERIVDVSWGYTPNTGTIVWMEIEAIDRPYLLRDATIAISDNGGNILVAKSVTNSKRIVSLIFQLEISDNSQFETILKDAKNIENVFDASRIYPGRK